MTEHCLNTIMPDSFTGMIFAMEGIQNTIVLVNGPMGCKFYHSTTSQFLTIRPPLYLPTDDHRRRVPVDYSFLNHWFFRQSRVPCTYLDEQDYVFGTSEKVREGMQYIRENIEFDLFVIINSPGASLLGDHLGELMKEVFPEKNGLLLETPGYSEDFETGYRRVFWEVIRQLGPKLWMQPEPHPKTDRQSGKSVNLLGLTHWHRYCEGDMQELSRLFALCGIRINCCPFAGCSQEELRRLPEADLNIVLYPEMAEEAAQQLEKQYHIPYYLCRDLPIGFQAVEQMVTDVCRELEEDASPVLQECEMARAKAWYHLNNIHQMIGRPEGTLFAVEGTPSQVRSYRRFLSEYLGMIPESMDAAEVVLAEANTIAALRTHRSDFTGIEINRPDQGFVEILPRTHMGVTGTLYLIEQVLNAVLMQEGI